MGEKEKFYLRISNRIFRRMLDVFIEILNETPMKQVLREGQ